MILWTARLTAQQTRATTAYFLLVRRRTSAYTDANSGYRYYDNDNISRILQIQKFQWMGFSPAEICSYYAGGGKADELLTSLEKKLSILQL